MFLHRLLSRFRISGGTPSLDPSFSDSAPSLRTLVSFLIIPVFLPALFVSGPFPESLPLGILPIPSAWADSTTVLNSDSSPASTVPVLTLEQAIRLALDRNPSLAGERAQIAMEKSRSIQAGELSDPKLVLGEQYFPINLNMGQSLLTMTTVGLRQSFPSWGKRALLHRHAVREEESSRWTLKNQEIRLVRDVRLSWIELYRDNRTQSMLLSIGSLWKKAFQAALSRFRQGTGSESDVLQAQFQKDNLKDRVEMLKLQEEESLHRLMRLMRTSQPFEVAGNEPSLPEPFSESVLLERLNAHPALKSLSLKDQAQALLVQSAKKDRIPAFSVEGDYSYFMGPSLITSTPNLFSVILTMNLPVRPGERQDQKVREEEHAFESASARREEVRQKLVEDVRNSEGVYSHLTRREIFLERSLLPEAKRNVEVALRGYSTGAIGMGEVLSAMKKVEETEIRALSVRTDRLKTMAELSYLAGISGGVDSGRNP
ncbi:MAG: TolC family protein [Leptospirales bacterium]